MGYQIGVRPALLALREVSLVALREVILVVLHEVLPVMLRVLQIKKEARNRRQDRG